MLLFAISLTERHIDANPDSPLNCDAANMWKRDSMDSKHSLSLAQTRADFGLQL